MNWFTSLPYKSRRQHWDVRSHYWPACTLLHFYSAWWRNTNYKLTALFALCDLSKVYNNCSLILISGTLNKFVVSSKTTWATLSNKIESWCKGNARISRPICFFVRLFDHRMVPKLRCHRPSIRLHLEAIYKHAPSHCTLCANQSVKERVQDAFKEMT